MQKSAVDVLERYSAEALVSHYKLTLVFTKQTYTTESSLELHALTSRAGTDQGGCCLVQT